MKVQKYVFSLLCGVASLGAVNLGLTAQAQACDCVDFDLTRQYAESQHVFTARMIFSFELANRVFYLALVEDTYKGCAPANRITWLQTNKSSAACGDSFAFGPEYLIQASEGNGAFGFALSTGSCSGNRLAKNLSDKDWKFLKSREVCCNGSCTCAAGVDRVNCLVDPCTVATPCKGEGAETCEANGCGGCNAEYFNGEGKMVCLGKEDGACTSDKDCPNNQYCGFDSVCADDATCNFDGECNLPGNDFNNLLKCLGRGVCEQNACVYKCGGSRCIDHKGYDFGDCEAVLGYLVLDGKCQSVSGCDSLLSQVGQSTFPSLKACEDACNVEPTRFACGDKLRCNAANSYCQITYPGVEPAPGEPKQYEECMPLPAKCAGAPSCERCFSTAENGGIAQSCDASKGGLEVILALP